MAWYPFREHCVRELGSALLWWVDRTLCRRRPRCYCRKCGCASSGKQFGTEKHTGRRWRHLELSLVTDQLPVFRSENSWLGSYLGAIYVCAVFFILFFTQFSEWGKANCLYSSLLLLLNMYYLFLTWTWNCITEMCEAGRGCGGELEGEDFQSHQEWWSPVLQHSTFSSQSCLCIFLFILLNFSEHSTLTQVTIFCHVPTTSEVLTHAVPCGLSLSL